MEVKDRSGGFVFTAPPESAQEEAQSSEARKLLRFSFTALFPTQAR